MKLTQRQLKIYEFIAEFINKNEYPPSQAEIADYFGYKSHNSVCEHLALMEKKGAITRRCNVPRSIRLLPIAA